MNLLGRLCIIFVMLFILYYTNKKKIYNSVINHPASL